MKVIRRSPITGRVNEMEINISTEQLQKWQSGELIQNVCPHLSPDEREFLISGCTPDDWKTMFGEKQ